MEDIGKRIHELRKSNHMTQAFLGRIVDLHGSNISRIEQNIVIPDGIVIRKIADYFHVSCDYLLGREPISTSESVDCLIAANEEPDLEHHYQPNDPLPSMVDIQQLLLLYKKLNPINREELIEIAKLKLRLQGASSDDLNTSIS